MIQLEIAAVAWRYLKTTAIIARIKFERCRRSYVSSILYNNTGAQCQAIVFCQLSRGEQVWASVERYKNVTVYKAPDG